MAKKKKITKTAFSDTKIKLGKAKQVVKTYSFPEYSLAIQATSLKEAKRKLNKMIREGVNK